MPLKSTEASCASLDSPDSLECSLIFCTRNWNFGKPVGYCSEISILVFYFTKCVLFTGRFAWCRGGPRSTEGMFFRLEPSRCSGGKPATLSVSGLLNQGRSEHRYRNPCPRFCPRWLSRIKKIQPQSAFELQPLLSLRPRGITRTRKARSIRAQAMFPRVVCLFSFLALASRRFDLRSFNRPCV